MQIIAHRGASGDFPEQTVVAYENALAQDSDGWECDVRLTSDEHVVCVHDRTIDRVSDGSGRVSQMTVEELREFNFGTERTPQRILEFSQLLEMFLSSRDEHPGLEIFVETKHPVSAGKRLEQCVVNTLESYGFASSDAVHIISFSPRSLARMKKYAPDLHRIQLHDPRQVAAERLSQRAGVPNSYGYSVKFLRDNPDMLNTDERLYLWTANSAHDIEWAQKNNIAWCATNFPGFARDVLA